MRAAAIVLSCGLEMSRQRSCKRRTVSMSKAMELIGRVPHIFELGRLRFRAQIRPLGLAAIVGVVAGIGAIFFYVATRVAEHYALGMICGYVPEPHPGGEPIVSFLPAIDHPLVPWLLLIVPTVGGLIS